MAKRGDAGAVVNWYEANKRDLPWRATGVTPWQVLVSEVLLVQTQVSRALPAWTDFVARWPTPAAMAASAQSDVVRAWGRLGYPRRAVHLHRSAQWCVEYSGGEVPNTYDGLRLLPGVGDYIASAVLAFAYGQKVAVLDVNVRRVRARYFDGIERPLAALPRVHEQRHALASLPALESATYSVGLMELGALVCRAKRPRCGECPLQQGCAWRAAGYPSSPPKRRVASYRNSDRAARGAVLAALRSSEVPLQPDLQWLRPNQIEIPQRQDQLDRALTTLTADGLVTRHADGRFSLS